MFNGPSRAKTTDALSTAVIASHVFDTVMTLPASLSHCVQVMWIRRYQI